MEVCACISKIVKFSVSEQECLDVWRKCSIEFLFPTFMFFRMETQTDRQTLFITLAGSKNNLSNFFSFRELFHKIENECPYGSCYIATFSNFRNMLQSIFYFVKRKRFNARKKSIKSAGRYILLDVIYLPCCDVW